MITAFPNLRSGGYLGVEKFPGPFGADLVMFPVYRDGHAAVLALAHAKVGGKIDPVVEGFFLDELLKGLDHVVGTFDVAGTADTDV
jgi:hypothetical protein